MNRHHSSRWGQPALILLTLGLMAGACQPTPSAHPGPGANVQPQQVARIPAGRRADAVVADDRWVWVANSADGTVTQIDSHTDRVAATIQTGDPQALIAQGCQPDSVHTYHYNSWFWRDCDDPSSVAVDAGFAWVPDNATREILRIDPTSHRVVARIPVGIQIWRVAAGHGRLWVTDYGNNRVVVVDESSNQVLKTLDIAGGPSVIAPLADATWVVGARSGTLTQIDQRSFSILSQIDIGTTGNSIVANEHDLWIKVGEGGTLSRVDVPTGRVVSTLALGPNVGRYGVDCFGLEGGSIWVGGLHVQRIDTTTNQIAETLPFGGLMVAARPGNLWALNEDGTVSHYRLRGH